MGSFDSRQLSVGLNQQLAGDAGGRGHYLRIDANTGSSHGWVDGNRSHASQIAASALSDLGSDVTQTFAFEYQREQVDRPYWGTPLMTNAQAWCKARAVSWMARASRTTTSTMGCTNRRCGGRGP